MDPFDPARLLVGTTLGQYCLEIYSNTQKDMTKVIGNLKMQSDCDKISASGSSPSDNPSSGIVALRP
jgi:hypothetical protein